MPLDVARLRDSDLASDETPEACWAAVLLWAASWHQIPAASIPDNENWIAKHAGYAQRGKIDKDWPNVRPGALRGWVMCSDGRLYHPVVSEKANDAWAGRIKYREKKEAERLRKAAEREAKRLAEEQKNNPFCPLDLTGLSAGQNELSAGCTAENALIVDSGQWTVDSGQKTVDISKQSSSSVQSR